MFYKTLHIQLKISNKTREESQVLREGRQFPLLKWVKDVIVNTTNVTYTWSVTTHICLVSYDTDIKYQF